ncbi:hypothetical protein CVU37_12745 [candidate division BRC1 bacterium HGW-BRC1-1]|jgi:F-type H+-transporting ATPase subunit epsilon|nr:MAG: hypothetical protein CVU37_12745 [candidate division BRC1 bacterium HGW-BRC1-1]
MAKQFQLQVITQEKKILDAAVTSLVLPGVDGYFGVLADHAPLIATLGKGKMTVKQGESNVQEWSIDGGFMEMLDNTATVLVDALVIPPKG